MIKKANDFGAGGVSVAIGERELREIHMPAMKAVSYTHLPHTQNFPPYSSVFCRV